MIFTPEDVIMYFIHPDGTETEITGFIVDEGEINDNSKYDKLKERASWKKTIEESGEVVFVVG